MIVTDTIHLALRNLREAILRSGLTALGVSIGIASLVGMVSFGVALQDQIVGSFLRSGMFNSITVTSALPAMARLRRTKGMERFIKGIEPAQPPAARPKLDDGALQKLAALDRVKEVYPDIRVPVEVKLEDFSEYSVAAGVSMSARGEGVFQQINIGQFFPNDAGDSCMISLDFAHHMTDGDVKALLGKELTLGYATSANPAPSNPGVPGGGLSVQRTEKKFRIVGIIERQAGAGLGAGMFTSVMIPLATARQMNAYDVSNPQDILRQLSEKSTYTTATVKVARPQDTEEVEKKIRDMGFTVVSVADLMQGQKRAFILLDLLLGLVGSIALTVASLGIINTMVMSILERTREIGIMKAVGGSDEDIRRIFLIEATLIGLVGGAFGIVLGWAVGRVINLGANIYLQNQGAPTANLFTIPWWLVAGGVGFALLISLLAGSFPAMRAARLDPIQALRHD
jgi:putative ABC transport system permease protein